MKVSKKIKDYIDTGLWTKYGHPDDDYVATACSRPTRANNKYSIGYHHGSLPAFKTETFETLAELEAAMRKLEPDLRKWRAKFE